MDDYLAILGLLIDRLTGLMPGVTIKPSWGLSRIQENFDTPPAVIVMLEDDRPLDTNMSGTTQIVEQVWTCIVIVKDSASEAGPLISQVIKAVSGWQPASAYTPFRRVKAGLKHDFSPSSALYFPLSFATSFTFNVKG